MSKKGEVTDPAELEFEKRFSAALEHYRALKDAFVDRLQAVDPDLAEAFYKVWEARTACHALLKEQYSGVDAEIAQLRSELPAPTVRRTRKKKVL